MSWVGPPKRKALIDFAAAKLKPGGLLYVSYNALPGWAAVEPLRQLIARSRGALAEGDSSSGRGKGSSSRSMLSEPGRSTSRGTRRRARCSRR